MPSFIERMLLLPSALLALSLSRALAHGLQERDGNPTTVPAPISVAPSGSWDGIDGSWSSFTLKIGTPPQEVHTFVSWSVYQTWAVLPDGCGHASNQNACEQDRGGFFNEKASTSFDRKGLYDLWVGRTLGLYGDANYGYDTVAIERDGGGALALKNTIVGGFAVEDFYMGIFGINPKPTNFTSYNDQSQSYMTLLKEQGYIPSVSFGYTAGAPYRSNSSFASLTLGGYDTSKFIKNPVTWKFGPNNARDIIVAVQSIYTPSRDPSSPIATELLPSPIFAYLDALVPEIWLPVAACEYFEFEFGLEYDNATELYLVNSTWHQHLLDRNASITFQLGKTLDGGATVSIELPYAAFDLTANSPYHGLSSPTFYFPLRRAANESQYFIGRTFFQEAYISIDYERQHFNVSQRDWAFQDETHLVGIPHALGVSIGAGLPGKPPLQSNRLGGGIIAGIVIGAVAVIAILALLAWLYRRHKKNMKKQRGEKLESNTGSDNNISPSRGGQEETGYVKPELEGSVPNLQERPPLASGALSQDSSGSAPITPRSPQHLSGATFTNQRGQNVRYSPDTDSPVDGSGTHSSADTSTGTSRGTGYGTGTGTMMSLVSPISPSPTGTAEAAEADSKERQIYEMPGDTPPVGEKDGKELSEKEAMELRQKVYNGVESPVEPLPIVNFSRSSLQDPRRVNPEDVTTTNTVLDNVNERRDFTRHRAFSFELERNKEENSEELYE